MNIQDKIDQLSDQINELARHQTNLTKQLVQLMNELEQLKKQAGEGGSVPGQPSRKITALKEPAPAPSAKPVPEPTLPAAAAAPTAASRTGTPFTSEAPKKKTTLEEFIGGNLTSKAGILITIIGIFIGAKYAIEHNLVNPMVRVVMGYVNGLILIGVAIRLKKKYEQYSSVLMGGGLAVLYFITYIAYSFYEMLPQLAAFGLMLLFTAATVYAAMIYNRIIIAHLGLIGAYAIPILLSDNSGRYAVLFTYIAIINAGILILSLKKYWKSLFYVAFLLTWAIYSIWFTWDYEPRHFTIAFIFAGLFFVIFYATFLAYKLIRKEQYNVGDVSVLLSNAFIFYGFGYGILDSTESTAHMPGLFTVINALIHLTVCLVIRKLQLADKALFYLLLGLVITFFTIAVPVQLDGSWVTLLWTMEAVVVFFVGRTQGRTGYEKLAVVLCLLSFLSLCEDWSGHPAITYSSETAFPALFTNHFLTGLLVAIAQGGMLYLHHTRPPKEETVHEPWYLIFYEFGLSLLFLGITYSVFVLEIQAYFTWLGNTAPTDSFDEIDTMHMCVILLYTMVFFALMMFVNERWLKRKQLAGVTVVLSIVVIGAVLFTALPELNEMSAAYRTGTPVYYGSWITPLRYTLMAVSALMLVLGSRSLLIVVKDLQLRKMYGVFVHVAVLGMISYEYLHWMSRQNSDDEYKLGLSILWSVYALCLIVAGINKKKKHWRLTGIAFFVITLIKLFAFDLNQTTTISKTISFISLGAILLLVSYLYNRYKHVILMDDEDHTAGHGNIS